MKTTSIPRIRASNGSSGSGVQTPDTTSIRRSEPKWATEFARELKRENGDYKVVNNLGEFVFEIRADERTGVIDMYAGPSREQLAVFPTRAVQLPDGRTSYSFTMFQGPGMPDELFESQHASLKREFENIEAILS